MGQARKSLWIETKGKFAGHPVMLGQARKSLWIETLFSCIFSSCCWGQARKSLWIETQAGPGFKLHLCSVRLVRACGSKLSQYLQQIRNGIGQARKSLWIETQVDSIATRSADRSGS